MIKKQKVDEVIYYAAYKKENNKVSAEVPTESVFCPNFTGDDLNEVYNKVERYFQSIAIEVKKDKTVVLPNPMDTSEIRVKFPTAVHRYSQLKLNTKTGKLEHSRVNL